MSRTRSLLTTLFAVLASACAGGISHTKVVDPQVVAKVTGLERIGPFTSMKEADGTLYVAGQTGLAAVTPQGAIRWAIELPAATFRWVDADGAGAAFSAYDLARVDRATGIAGFIMGNTGDEPEYSNQKLGLVSADGKLAWSVDLGGGKYAASRPGMSPAQIAVSRGNMLAAYAREGGAKAFESPLAGSLAFDSQVLQSSYNQPAFLDGAWYAVHLNHFVKYGANGDTQSDNITFGLFTPFQNITSGLVVVDGKLLFGASTWEPKKRSRLFAGEKSGGEAWDSYLDDQQSGVSAITANGSLIFAASNFKVAAYSYSGKERWTDANGKGGLYYGYARGVRYIGNSFSKTFAIRKSQGQTMVADEKNVYVTAKHHKGDAITVLDTQTGAYVDSIDIQDKVRELSLFGPNLAVATDDAVMLIAR